MELLIPKSLIVAMNKTYIAEYEAKDISMCLHLVVKMISAYESKHHYIPSEWSVFLDNLNNVLAELTAIEQGEAMKNLFEIELKRTEWITKLVFEEMGMSDVELRALTMVELRDLYEDTFPSYITVKSATATGGVSRLMTKIAKPA